MKKTMFCFVVFMMFVTELMAANYTVTLSEDRLRHADVVATLNPADGRLSFTRNARDTGLYHGWATFVHEIEAFDFNDEPIELEFVPEGYWRLVNHDGGPVTVRYHMLLQHDRFPNDPGDDELAWARDWGVMWTGRALFLESAEESEIRVEFNVPEGWKVSTPWERTEADTISFSVPAYDDLLDSAFVAGTHEEIIIGDSERPSAILAMGGDARESSELIAGLVGEGLDAFTRLFDSAPAKQLLLIAVDGSFWGGGVMGSTISMMQGGPLDESTTPMLAYITTHEMFHLWNSNFNIAGQEDSDALQWFGEGAAEYYTWRNFAQSRQVDANAMLDEWGKRYSKYLAARTDMSMSDAGTVKLDNYDLIYSGGMMATAALDLTIRSESRGVKSLDDALRLLQSRYPAGSEKSLKANELPGVIAEATGVDVDAIFDQFIFGNEELPMDHYFELAGLLLKPAEEAGSDVVSITDVRTDQQIRVWNSFIE